MQVQEIRSERDFRRIAMDSLAREISGNLPDGWQCCSPPPPVEGQTLWKHLAGLGGRTLTDEEAHQRIEYQMSGVYAYWVVLLQKYDPKVDARAIAVWNALKSLAPPTGWLPKGADDPLIIRAFDVGWPETAKRQIKRQQYGLLCPNCTAVLSLPPAEADEIVCQLCGEHIELV
jgi:hypothetical protein